MTKPLTSNTEGLTLLEAALRSFSEIKHGFEVNKSLGWDASVESLKAARSIRSYPEVIPFLDEYLLRMITILVSQSPSKLGAFETKHIDKSLHLAMEIVLHVLPTHPRFLQVLVKIFDPSAVYYAGHKISWTHHPGFPAVRANIARGMAELNGFEILFRVLRGPDMPWLGADTLSILLKAFSEVIHLIDETVRVEIINEMTKSLLTLGDEQLKRENTDSLHSLIGALGQVYQWLSHNSPNSTGGGTLAFQTFWLEHTLKVINSGSLVLKLFGLDQVQELIRDAYFTRPLARSYIVSGAGNPIANGHYEFSSRDGDQVTYVKRPQSPGEPLLTLFKCSMRTKSKWWFLSQADKEKPGTDKDIDYYQHKSNIEEEREPQCYGWNCMGANNPLSKEPAPTLERVGELVEEGTDTSEHLVHKLSRWCLKNDLLDLVFSQSVHREVVSRSAKLVMFLSSVDVLREEHILQVWKAAMQSPDMDIVEEIFCLLVQVSARLKESLYTVLMNTALATLNSVENNAFLKVSMFAEKFGVESFRDSLNLLSVNAARQLLALVWSIYRHAGFESLKNSVTIQDLLSRCFGLKGGANMALQRVRECSATLQTYNDKSNDSSSAGPVVSSMEDEAAISRVIHTLQFLISRHVSQSAIENLNTGGFSDVIIGEIMRFSNLNRNRFPLSLPNNFSHPVRSNSSSSLYSAVSGSASPCVTISATSTEWYSTQLSERLQVMRQFYGLSRTVKIPLIHLHDMWRSLKNSPVEMEEFFCFLTKGVDNKGALLAMSEWNDCLYIFKNFVCSPDVVWSLCGENAYDCFAKFFIGLKVPPEGVLPDLQPPKLGLDTLWQIVVSIPSEHSMRSASDLLLSAYDNISHEDVDAHEQMLTRIFSQLTSARNQLAAGDGIEEEQQKALTCVDRLVGLLKAAIVRSTGMAGQAHAVRGCMSRFQIKVFHRRVTSFYNNASQQDVVRTEKGSDGCMILEVHPMQTIFDLKKKIVQKAGNNTISKVTIEKNGMNWADNVRLNELELVDGSDVAASFLVSFPMKPTFEDNLAMGLSGDDSLPHIGQAIASDEARFNCLLSLCEAVDNPAVAQSIWKLLMLIPTQLDILRFVEEVSFQSQVKSVYTAASMKGLTGWTALLGVEHASCPRITYALQIIDNILLPAPEFRTDKVLEHSVRFRAAFITSGGFSSVLQVLIAIPSAERGINRDALASALNIIHFFLFGAGDDLNSSADFGDLDASRNFRSPPPLPEKLKLEVQACSNVVAEKLLTVASAAAAEERSGVVHNALKTITFLLIDPKEASKLISNPQSRTLLATVLRSGSKKVREMSADFAIQVGSSQPVVFSWLIAEMETLDPSDSVCSDIFRALGSLLVRLSEEKEAGAINMKELGALLSSRLMSYPRGKHRQEERQVLTGYLDLLEKIIRLDPSVVRDEAFGGNLVRTFLKEFLFTMPTDDEQDKAPICDSSSTRQAAFGVLSAYLAIAPEPFEDALQEVIDLSTSASQQIKCAWGLQVSNDVKRADVTFSGLKNQGCTCYMNSLLQQFFMNTSFRAAILNTNMRECHRSTLWHRAPEGLVGLDLLIEWQGGLWKQARVLSYDPLTREHMVQYKVDTGIDGEVISFELKEGRYQRETGNTRVAPPVVSTADGQVAAMEPLNERDEAALRVLEQLQRTFCFMQFSKRRYYDPRSFVDACKTLNLNFNVYHQNDAAEFCDQLLDRIENATQGKQTNQNVWNDVIQKQIFGGKSLYQKIPQGCEAYNTDKQECGHWQSSRLESFLKIELLIRGKDKIDDSLAEMIIGELMDGDNKVDCDVCAKKKATIRRTCIGKLPNTMVLHLKRFDLDFQTFETVKLNNRMAFSTRLNMLKYTKEGIEAEERKEQRAAAQAQREENADAEEGTRRSADDGIAYEAPATGEAELDALDFEYELQGVLVHAGIAQGGHYYSFICDTDTANAPATLDLNESMNSSEKRWYRFEDEDVSHFSPDQIAPQCFGGPAFNGTQSGEEDRTSNALMLFFNKVRPSDINEKGPEATQTSPSPEEDAPKGDRAKETEIKAAPIPLDTMPGGLLVNGYQAFGREVRESNLNHVLSCYVLDTDLHGFVRGLISSISSSAAAKKPTSSGTLEADSQQAIASPLSPPSALRWAPSKPVQVNGVTGDDLPLRTVQFGCSFLLNVVLHCRERAGMRAWVTVLREAFETFPHTAVWFIKTLLSQECTWMSDFLVRCTDSLARGTFVQVVVQAATVIAPKEPGGLMFCTAGKESDLLSMCNSEDPKKSACAFTALLVKDVMIRVLSVPMHIRVADELFVLIRDLAAIPSACITMIQSGAISRLAYFAIPDGVPIPIKNLFTSRIPVQRSHNKNDFCMLLQSVFEALASLLAVPQMRKVPLLQERTYWESELVAEAKEAFTTIFQEMSITGGMDAGCMSDYMEKVNGPGQKVTPLQVRSILDRFHTNSDNRLSLEGFLQYQTDQAWYNAKNVWKDLSAFGYRNNLQRAVPGSVSTLSALSEEAHAGGMQLEYWIIKTIIPATCKACLLSLSLYETGMDTSEPSAKAIAKKVCTNDPEFSSELLKQTMQRLARIASESPWGPTLANLTDFIHLLLTVEDDLTEMRVRTVLLDHTHGFAVIVNQERIRPSISRANDYERGGVFHRFIGFIQDLCVLPAFVNGINALARDDPRVRYVKGQLNLTPGLKLMEYSAISVRNTEVEVVNAGLPCVNGIYQFVTFKNNAGYFSRIGSWEGNTVNYTLYKCSVNNGGFQWFISITPDGSEPGTSKDTDFYFCQASQDPLGNTLPPKPFQALQSGTAYEPGPSVICRKPSDDYINEVLRVVPGGSGVHRLPLEPDTLSEEKSEYAGYGQLPSTYYNTFPRYGQDQGQDTSTDLSHGSGSCNDNADDSVDIDVDDQFDFSRAMDPSLQADFSSRTRSQGLNNLALDLDLHLGPEDELENDRQPELDSSSDEGSMVVGSGESNFIEQDQDQDNDQDQSGPGSPSRDYFESSESSPATYHRYRNN